MTEVIPATESKIAELTLMYKKEVDSLPQQVTYSWKAVVTKRSFTAAWRSFLGGIGVHNGILCQKIGAGTLFIFYSVGLSFLHSAFIEFISVNQKADDNGMIVI